VPIDWHADSRSFFVGTFHDGSLYRGRLDDPTVQLFLEGTPGQSASGIAIADGLLYVSGGNYGEIRVHDLETKALVGSFSTGQGGFLNDLVVTDAGDVYVTDALRPVLWHLSPEQVAAGSGTPAAIPLSPEIPYIRTPDNVEGIVALTDTRLVVVKYADGTLYRIDLDGQAPEGRTITPITGATVRLGARMTLDSGRLVVADEEGVSVVELDDGAASGSVVAQIATPRSGTRPPSSASTTGTSWSTQPGTSPRPTPSQAFPPRRERRGSPAPEGPPVASGRGSRNDRPRTSWERLSSLPRWPSSSTAVVPPAYLCDGRALALRVWVERWWPRAVAGLPYGVSPFGLDRRTGDLELVYERLAPVRRSCAAMWSPADDVLQRVPVRRGASRRVTRLARQKRQRPRGHHGRQQHHTRRTADVRRAVQREQGVLQVLVRRRRDAAQQV
jgi:Cu-Zn family superoxide dismutase